MKRVTRILLVAALACGMSGCASLDHPTYEDVRRDALDAMQTIVDRIPEPKVVRPRPEFEPYGCRDALLGTNNDGAFFTGYWEVEVADDLDVAQFVLDLPSELGDGWADEPQLISVSFAQTNLVQVATKVSITVEERERNGKKGIDVLAISPCGIEARQTDSPTN